jgi:hypothetical protein
MTLGLVLKALLDKSVNIMEFNDLALDKATYAIP